MDVIWSVLAGLHFQSTAFFCQVILFFFMHYSLKFLVYTPIMEIRELRDKRIASNLAAAEAATAEARRVKDEYEEKVRLARAEGQAALATATAAAEAERKVRLDKAREQSGVILEQANAAAAAAREKADATVGAQSEQVALAIATRLVTASLGQAEAAPVLARLGGKS
jgi:F-type H+-transporting ATPase subunit b